MPILSRRVLFISMAMVIGGQTVAIAAPPPNAAPKAIVEWIYAETVRTQAKTSGSFYIFSKANLALFSKPFVAAYRKADALATKKEEPLIEADPISNSQDPQVSAVVVKAQEQTELASTIVADFKSSGKPERVVFKFVKDGDRWKIDDMIVGLKDSYSIGRFLRSYK